MIYHMIAFVGGFFLDLIMGDPYNFPHPVRWIGRLISAIDKHDLGEEDTKALSGEQKRRCGRRLVLLVCGTTILVTAFVLLLAYGIHPMAGCLVEMFLTYQTLALRCLCKESKKVYICLRDKTLEDARYAVSMIVGRDTQNLSPTGVAKAAIETVAENTSDGEIAPMLYLALGGPILGLTYKAINTMDSMVGYKNDKYLYFGRAAAKFDDVMNFLPSRISGILMVLAAPLVKLDGKNAWKIFKRDRLCHASPNSAQTESVMAGALQVQLAGDAWYFGKKHEKPTIGDPIRPVEIADIARANWLLYAASALGMIVFNGIKIILLLLLL